MVSSFGKMQIVIEFQALYLYFGCFDLFLHGHFQQAGGIRCGSHAPTSKCSERGNQQATLIAAVRRLLTESDYFGCFQRATGIFFQWLLSFTRF
jgi:hypothetical protein